MQTRLFHLLCSHDFRCRPWPGLFAGWVSVICLLGLFFPGTAAALEGDAQPPARVGQLALVTGNTLMRIDRTAAWESAVLNTPFTSGSALATQIPGRAEVRIGSAALRMGQEAKVAWIELNDSTLHLELTYGLFAMRLRALAPGERVLVSAGGVTVQLLKAGSYRFRHVAQRLRLRVWVLEGQARVALNQQEIMLGPNEQVQIDKATASPLTASASADHESFDEFDLSRERRKDGSLALAHVPAEMTGAEALDGNGNWRQEAGHGAVWFPNTVPADWAPYRFGRWRWLAPWGWTWIDDANWGFAPFHYGRWLFSGGRWGWVPGHTAAASAAPTPVYAPALVGFFGNQAGAVWTSTLAPTPLVGWYPLAPGEIYWPPYSSQLAYARALNAASVTDATQIQAPPLASAAVPLHRYARTAFAATAMPYAAFSNLQDVASNQILLSPAALAQAPLSGRRWPPAPQPSVRPTTAPAKPSATALSDDQTTASPTTSVPKSTAVATPLPNAKTIR